MGNVLINKLTNIGKFAVLKDHKVVLLGQSSKLVNQILIEILDNINVGLFRRNCSKEKNDHVITTATSDSLPITHSHKQPRQRPPQ